MKTLLIVNQKLKKRTLTQEIVEQEREKQQQRQKQPQNKRKIKIFVYLIKDAKRNRR